MRLKLHSREEGKLSHSEYITGGLLAWQEDRAWGRVSVHHRMSAPLAVAVWALGQAETSLNPLYHLLAVWPFMHSVLRSSLPVW